MQGAGEIQRELLVMYAQSDEIPGVREMERELKEIMYMCAIAKRVAPRSEVRVRVQRAQRTVCGRGR